MCETLGSIASTTGEIEKPEVAMIWLQDLHSTWIKSDEFSNTAAWPLHASFLVLSHVAYSPGFQKAPTGASSLFLFQILLDSSSLPGTGAVPASYL